MRIQVQLFGFNANPDIQEARVAEPKILPGTFSSVSDSQIRISTRAPVPAPPPSPCAGGGGGWNI
jgi:hypothetical protein